MGTNLKHQRQLELFQPAGLFGFVTIDIHGKLPRIKTGNQFVVIIKDKHSKLTRVIPSTERTSR